MHAFLIGRPVSNEMPERLDAVLTVIYLVFNEGYTATRGEPLVRSDLCAEAIRLGRLVRTLMASPAAEATGLLALMLLHDARRHARLDENGDLITLEKQDRSRVGSGADRRSVASRKRVASRPPGSLCRAVGDRGSTLQARRRPEETDWPQILQLYDFLEHLDPSPIVSLNRAVAVAMARGIQPALTVIDALAKTGDLNDYHLLHSTRADLLRRLGSSEEAAKAMRERLN